MDRIIETGDEGRLQGIKNITATESFFRDHFPRKPVLPGVITIDCLASLASLLARRHLDRQGLELRQCLKIKFRKFIEPGDQLHIDVRLSSFSPDGSSFKALGTVGGKKAAQLEVFFDHLERDEYVEKYLAGVSS